MIRNQTQSFILTLLLLFCCMYLSSLSMGTKTGYRLFSITSVDKMDSIHEGGKDRRGSTLPII